MKEMAEETEKLENAPAVASTSERVRELRAEVNEMEEGGFCTMTLDLGEIRSLLALAELEAAVLSSPPEGPPPDPQLQMALVVATSLLKAYDERDTVVIEKDRLGLLVEAAQRVAAVNPMPALLSLHESHRGTPSFSGLRERLDAERADYDRMTDDSGEMRDIGHMEGVERAIQFLDEELARAAPVPDREGLEERLRRAEAALAQVTTYMRIKELDLGPWVVLADPEDPDDIVCVCPGRHNPELAAYLRDKSAVPSPVPEEEAGR